MIPYSEQLKIIKRYKVPDGVSRRMNCPFCNGYNTLGVSNINGMLEWHCFKASCGVRGINSDNRSLANIKSRLIAQDSVDNENYGATIPEFTTPTLHDKHIEWLKSVNSYEAYINNLVDIVYAPSVDRLLFSSNNGKGWIGRKFGKYGPKWLKYGSLPHLFACGTGGVGVIVEDAPSACAVGVIPSYTGLAILSTNFTTQHKLDIAQYDRLYICLDPDAARKSIELSKSISGLKENKVILIPNDLKFYNPAQIKEILSK